MERHSHQMPTGAQRLAENGTTYGVSRSFLLTNSMLLGSMRHKGHCIPLSFWPKLASSNGKVVVRRTASCVSLGGLARRGVEENTGYRGHSVPLLLLAGPDPVDDGSAILKAVKPSGRSLSVSGTEDVNRMTANTIVSNTNWNVSEINELARGFILDLSSGRLLQSQYI